MDFEGVSVGTDVTKVDPRLRLKILRYRARKQETTSPNPMLSVRLADALEQLGDVEEARLEYHEAAQMFLRVGFARKARSVYKLLLERFIGDDDARYGYEVACHECDQQTSGGNTVRAALLQLADGDDLDLRTDPGVRMSIEANTDEEPTLDPFERRRTPRIPWPAAIHVFDGQKVIACHSLNVSTTGLLVEADIDLDPGTEVQLSIGVPGQPWQGNAHGTVVSCGPSRTAVIIQKMDKLTLRHVIQKIAEVLCVSPAVIRHVHREAQKASRRALNH